MLFRSLLLPIAGLTAFGMGILTGTGHGGNKKLDFNRDIRPIITKCITCHGHDPKAVMANLRLDIRDEATKPLADGKIAIVPGAPDRSEMIRRIFSKNPDDQMPPPDSNKFLTDDERQSLRQWIAEGAEYKQHWGFVAPVRPPTPRVSDAKWPHNPIDNFVLAKLDEEGLKPSKQADKRTLIRRVSLDIIGLPPTPKEVAAFLADNSPKAFERVVDRLLASPRYGERMAMDWMDYSRYADSNGYQADYERYQWRWRDWVIDAYNRNMPYDEFVVEQLAGDLLPNATLDQKIATGFNRNHRINTEGGVIAQEWKVETVIDRVETTSETFLGLTAGCARCHDHKYDPISQKEFYSLYAYFNRGSDTGTGVEQPVNHPPVIKAPTAEQSARLSALDRDLASVTKLIDARLALNSGKARVWQPGGELALPAGELGRFALEPGAKSVLGAVESEAGFSGAAAKTGDKGYFDLGQAGDFDQKTPFSYSIWIKPTGMGGSPLSKMDVGSDYRGWDLYMNGDRPAFHFINKWPESAFKIISRERLPIGKWSHIVLTYDGSSKAAGATFYVNGVRTESDVEADMLTGTTKTPVSLKVGRRTGADVFTGGVADLILYPRALSVAEVAKIHDVVDIAPLISIPEQQRAPEQREKLVRFWSEENDSRYRQLSSRRRELANERAKLDGQISSVMIMDEVASPPETHVLIRGEYDKLGDTVSPAIPAAFPPLPNGVPNNRLGFAKWIVDPSNPLTARVLVNRMWERLFGVGIVETSEDFGTQAMFPSNPELLDWLATELIRLKWDQKAMWKELVMTAAYQQSSDVSPELQKLDPMNRLIARGPRFRLPAEVIRDQALMAGGLLKEKIGGPSVRPYQPDGIWDETNVYGNLRNYKHDTDDGLHRRSLYTIWKRTAAPPEMTLFDVPSRETCRIRRARTNTPLQALALLNDVTYVEASRALAQRMMLEGGKSPESRIRFAFHELLSREPEKEELAILKGGLERKVAIYRRDVKAAEALLKQGDLQNDPGLDKSELAAYTLTASTLLNLDETLTKE